MPDFTLDFEDWWDKGYCTYDDDWSGMEAWQYHRIKLMAYRAYKRGKKMAEKKGKK